MNNQVYLKPIYTLTLLFIMGSFLTFACTTPSSSESSAMDASMEMDEEMDHQEGSGHEDEHDNNNPDTIPNEGAVIRITSPSDGSVIKVGEDLLVEVETENFILGEDDNHWHVYIDDSSWGMVMGGNHDQVLRGLGPGEHEIGVFLSIGTHEQLEDGDSITITVEE